MVRVTASKTGGMIIETDSDVDTIWQEGEAPANFVYLSPADAEALYAALGFELFDADMSRKRVAS